jgi:DNA-binding transcriptional regulator YiaG
MPTLDVSDPNTTALDKPSWSAAAKRMRQHCLLSGKQLKAARVLAGLSQKQLAMETGRSLRTITSWEAMSGKPTASRNSVERIKAALLRYGVALYVTPAGGYGVEKAPGSTCS